MFWQSSLSASMMWPAPQGSQLVARRRLDAPWQSSQVRPSASSPFSVKPGGHSVTQAPLLKYFEFEQLVQVSPSQVLQSAPQTGPGAGVGAGVCAGVGAADDDEGVGVVDAADDDEGEGEGEGEGEPRSWSWSCCSSSCCSCASELQIGL